METRCTAGAASHLRRGGLRIGQPQDVFPGWACKGTVEFYVNVEKQGTADMKDKTACKSTADLLFNVEQAHRKPPPSDCWRLGRTWCTRYNSEREVKLLAQT